MMRNSLLQITVVVLLAAATNGRKFTATGCLSDQRAVTLRCRRGESVRVKSVSYAHTPDCTSPALLNDCKQISAQLSRQAKQHCDGTNSCVVPVISIADFTWQQEEAGLLTENIEHTLASCSVNRVLVQNAIMNLFQVRYSCEEFVFCNALDDSVEMLSIATKSWPEKVTTNPTCGCTFESDDSQDLYINGFTQCNGTVTFNTEETFIDGTVEELEYKCVDELGGSYMMLGSNEPYRVKLSVNVEKSDEESSYQITWFNIKSHTKTRKMKLPVKVNCSAGKLYLKASRDDYIVDD